MTASALPTSDSRVTMPWSVYLDFVPLQKRAERTAECERIWGALPPVVEVHQNELRPIWADDPRFEEGL